MWTTENFCTRYYIPQNKWDSFWCHQLAVRPLVLNSHSQNWNLTKPLAIVITLSRVRVSPVFLSLFTFLRLETTCCLRNLLNMKTSPYNLDVYISYSRKASLCGRLNYSWSPQIIKLCKQMQIFSVFIMLTASMRSWKRR